MCPIIVADCGSADCGRAGLEGVLATVVEWVMLVYFYVLKIFNFFYFDILIIKINLKK
jgi:hypothetical protein